MKTYISYVPHGINEDQFFPIDQNHEKFQELQEFKKNLLQNKTYEFVLLFNSRNIRRKQIPDTLLSFKTFLDRLEPDQARKCCIVLHTQPIDENGTDLFAVRDMLFGESAEHHVIFSTNRGDVNFMNLLYNCADGVILLSSNEGWGLSLTEALMCGKPIIANVTGGMQDQMRFQDEHTDWILFDEKFSTNHLGKHFRHGSWALPVFPSNVSIQGSPLTPYILDDRCDFRGASNQIEQLYNWHPQVRHDIGLRGRAWVTGNESMMSAKNMSKNVIGSIDHLLANWEPREDYEVIKIDKNRKKKHVKHPISY